MLTGHSYIKYAPYSYVLYRVMLGLTALIGLNGCADGSSLESAKAYHSYSQMTQELSKIATQHHDIARLMSIGTTGEGRPIWALNISHNAVQDEAKSAALIVGGQHAREWISVEVPLHLAQHLTERYGLDSDVTRIVNTLDIWIVPLSNPDGYEYSRVTDRQWRKNRRNNRDGSFGVDLNRNFDYKWGEDIGLASSNPQAVTYQGPAPFSEPETQALRDLVLSRNFKIIVDYHSYAQVIAYPSNSLQMQARAQIIAALISAVHGQIYTASSYESPLFSGGFVDWAYNVVHIDAYLIELRPDATANPASAFELPEAEIEPTWEENRPALLFLLKAYGLLDQP